MPTVVEDMNAPRRDSWPRRLRSKHSANAVPFCSAEVQNAPSGGPIVTCELADGQIEASLSHTDGLAIVYVLVEGE